MNYRIAVVEDNKEDSDVLESCLKRYVSENCREVSISFFDSAELFLNSDPTDYEIIFMDIEMPGIDGMSAVRKLREINSDAVVLFVTNLAQYAVNGYEVRAFDFIVKPVKYYNFVMKMNRVFESLDKDAPKEVWVTTRQGKTRVFADECRYVEVMGHTIVLHTKNGNIMGTGSLKNVMEHFDGGSFVLCNQCYLVNLRYVSSVQGEVVKVGKDFLKISAPRRKSFISALNNYLATRKL